MLKKKITSFSSFFLIVLAAFLGGGAPPITKIGLKEIPPFSFVFFRFIFAVLILFPLFLKSKPKFNKDFFMVIVLSFLASINVIFFPFGVKLTTANIAQTIYTAVPIFSAVISFALLKERFNLIKVIGISIGFFGASFIILLPLFSKDFNFWAGMTGNLIILIASISYSFYSVLSKKFQSNYSPLQLVFYFSLTTLFLMFLFSFSDLKNYPNWWQNLTIKGWFSIFFMGSIGTVAYFLLVQILIKKTTPVVASTVLYLQPLATFVWSYFLLKETLSFLLIAGFLLVLIGVWFTNNPNLNFLSKSSGKNQS